MQFPHPPMPVFPADQAATFESFMRYEDVAQDGRMIPLALPPAMSGLWQAAIVNHPGARGNLAHGIIPILTRLTMSTLDQPIRVDRSISTRAGFELSHQLIGGEVARLFMNAWSEVSGIAGRIGPRQPDGPLAPAGRLFAEHTFTRPFATPDQRRVTRLVGEGYPAVPPVQYDAPAPETAADAPAGARWIGEPEIDPLDIVFTLDQTDSNQHVNSLVYIRAFLEAAQRKISVAGYGLKIRSRAVDIAYRKPCFAGDRVRAHLRLFDLDGAPGAAGMMAGEDGKPRCYVRVLFSP